MQLIEKTALLALALLLTACSHSQSFDLYEPVQSPNTSGSIDVYELGETISQTYGIIGQFHLGESGFSESCGYQDALYLARAKARELGADAVAVTRVKKPDAISTCYRVTTEILEYRLASHP